MYHHFFMQKVPQFTPNDKYFYKAQKDGYRARSAYKLIELQNRYKILKKGDVVLDLGAYPGSFIQVAKEIIGDSGKVIGIDLKKMKLFKDENIFLFEGDVFDEDLIVSQLGSIGVSRVDVIISDLAPNTTGQRDIDQWKSVELNIAVLKIAEKFVKKGGSILMKVFLGEDLPDLIKETKALFADFKTYKPDATRKRSFETYVVARGKDMIGDRKWMDRLKSRRSRKVYKTKKQKKN